MSRFNSRFLQPGTEAVDAFSQDWSTENNWLVPPTVLIGRPLSHLRDCKAIGTLIVPMWKSAQFGEWCFLANRPYLFVKGRAKSTLFGTKALKSRCLALRIDFAKYIRVSKVDFCTSPMGWCSVCRT